MNRPPRDAGRGAQWIGARPGPGAVTLLLVEIGAFLLYMFLDAPLWAREHLALIPALAIGPEPWQLVTNGLLHIHPLSILFDAIGIWFFASPIEQMIGKNRMLAVFAVGQLAGSVVAALVGRALAP